MLFWLFAAVLTVLLVLALARPLATRLSSDPAAESAVRIYKDQLSEIAADEARGLLGKAEAESARIEISRRLLAAATEADNDRRASGEVSARLLIRGLAAALPLSAVGLYLALGAPLLPDRPYAARETTKTADTTLVDLIGRVEKRLRDHPEDGQGWEVIAPIYLRQERYRDAAVAFARAIDLLGENPKRLTGLGEALVYQNNGLVTEEARRAFARLIEIAPDQPEPRFWLAVADEQDGRFAKAAETYRMMLAHGPAEAPWRPAVTERLATVERRLSSVAAAAPTVKEAPKATSAEVAPARGPSAADVAAAQQMAPADRIKMIEQMVASLAERLQKNGADPEGWERLVRSYAVLGRRDEALRALGEGRRALAGDAAGLARIEALAKSLGIEG